MQGIQNDLTTTDQITGGVCFAVTTTGECICKGFGDMDKEAAEAIAIRLILMASRLRNAARTPPSSSLLN
jgi:hypothetical protein